jgi:threonine dehydrogenase-like Zn-dependent dehydrogenase
MIAQAEERGAIKPGDTLIEATSGNTGIALAMAAAIKGYQLTLIMPSNMSEERKSSMRAYGATLIDVPPGDMEAARDLASRMQAAGEGVVLDQFGNTDNPRAHMLGTGPELWEQTQGRITHFVSSMGTTGTIMGTSRCELGCSCACVCCLRSAGHVDNVYMRLQDQCLYCQQYVLSSGYRRSGSNGACSHRSQAGSSTPSCAIHSPAPAGCSHERTLLG